MPPNKFVTRITLFLLLAAACVHAQVSFAVSSATASPNTAGSTNSQYQIVLNAITTFSTNFDLSLTFTNAFSLTAVSACQATLNGAAISTAACTLSSNSIVFTQLNIGSTVSTLSLAFTTSTALYSGSFITTITYYQPGNSSNPYNTNSGLISITSATMACSLTSSSAVVGATTNYTFTLSPSVTIAAGSILQIQFPAWSAYYLTNFPSFTSASVCGGQCSIRSPNTAQSFYNEILSYSGLYSTSSTSNRTLVLSNGRNPASTQTISITGNLLYYINSTSQPTYMTCTTSFGATTPGTFNGVTFNPANQSISATMNISLLLNLTNPISSNTYLLVSYATDLQLGYTYVTSNQQTTQITYSSSPNTILIGNLTNSTSQFSTLFMATFTLTNPPYAALPNSITFSTQNMVGSTYFQIDSRSISITSSASTISSSSASLSNTSIGVTSTVTIAFTSINSLVSGSKIMVSIPPEISLSGSSSCSCNVSSTCSILNATSVVINMNSAVAVGGTSYGVSISNINNPATTTPTSSFTINTYYTNTSTPVDALTSGLTLTATSVSLQSASAASSSSTVAANSTYTITLQNKNPLPATSYIVVTFPPQFQNSASAALSSFKAGSTLVNGCSMSAISTMKFKFTGCVLSNLAAGTTSTIVLVNVINPLSTKPTSSFRVQTYYNSNLMEYMYNNLIITLTLPTTLTYFAVTPTSSVANTVTTYQLSVSFAQTHNSGDRLLLTFPPTIILNSNFACSSSTTGISVACFQSNSTLLQLTLTGTTIPSSVVVSITKVQNNWYAGSNSFSLQTTTNDTNTYLVEQGTAAVTVTAGTLTLSYTPSNSLVLLSSSSLTITVTSPFTISAPIPNLLSLSLSVPGQFAPTTSCTTSISGAVCSLSGATYTLTSLGAFTNTINIVFTAATTYFSSSSVFTGVLSYNGSNIATDSSLKVTPYCTNPCKSCTSNFTQCTSCLPSPYASLNNLFVPNSSCVSNCPSGYYLPSSSTTCAQCNTSACLTCTTTANTCTSCSTPTFLSNNSCLQQCPNTYFGSGTTCVPCVNQCNNCTNATYCLTCVSGYTLNPDNTCALTCPSNYISLSAICTICTVPCSTCTGSVTKCTSCQAAYILYNNSCILACPLGQFQDSNNLCQNCISPCKYCTTALSCVSCVTGYYVYNATQCVAICPSGTFALASACSNCSSSCQTCANVATNCTSCQSGLFLYMSTCYSTCPTETYPYQGTCTSCVSPCNTCLNGAFSCSTCVADYYLLNTSCVTSCPSTGYTTINVSCVACPVNCITCSSSTTCAVCASTYYLYQGGCITQCPSTSPIIVNSACTSCSPECATCQQTPSNCLTCTLYYYKYSYTCLQSCPLSYYSNQMSYTCESGLSSKIVFFPVLITYLVVIAFLVVVRIFSRVTSLPTVLTALSGWFQLAVWSYLVSLLFASYLQLGVGYSIPQALLFLAIGCTVVCNIIYFKVNYPRLQEDEYVRKWQDINLNHTFFVAVRYIALFTHHKFFRIIYSKAFNSIHLSMVAFQPKNIFFLSTLFTVLCLAFSEMIALVGAFYLTYNKLLKDQVFYTAVQALIVTVVSILIELIDIYKPKDYFEDTQFMETKRYLEKVNNDSLNKLEDEYRAKDEGSIDGEKVMGMTSGKFVFSRRGNMGELGSMNDILFEQHSAATDVHQNNKKITKIEIEDIEMLDSEALNEKSLNSPKQLSSAKSPKSPTLRQKQKVKEQAKINIFEPIQEEEAEYYEVLKYDEEDFKTAAKIEEEKYEGNGSQQENQLENQRKMEFGVETQEITDDNMSLMEYRERKEEWNRIIDHRKNLAQQIFNTIDTGQLYKIDEPLNEDEEKDQSPVSQRLHNRTPQRVRRRKMANNNKTESELKLQNWLKQRKDVVSGMVQQQIIEEEQPRRKRRRKPKKNNKQLEEIYLQRLAEKVHDPKRKTYASSKNFKYEF